MRKLILINAMLAALVGWGGLKVKRDWQQFRIDHNIQNIQAVSEVKLQPVIRKTIGPRPDDARQLAENNVFSFDRNDVAIKQAAAAAQARPAGPKPVLFGTMLIGSPRMAMLGPGVSGNRSYRPMIVGDVIDGWTLVEVKDKSVVMENGGARETVFMNDPTAMVPRDYSRTAGPPAPSQAATVRPTASQQQAAPAPEPPPPATGNNPQSGPATAPKYRVIDTPFGKAKVIVDPQ
jgi:hypothetical protein